MTGPAATAWVNGRLVDAGAPVLGLGDRGFQIGDGLFETLRARRGAPIDWPEHRDRLLEAAALLAFRLPVDGEGLLAAIHEVLAANGLAGDGRAGAPVGDAALRITATRGDLPGRGTLPAGWADAVATVAIQAWPYAPPPPAQLERGLRLVTSSVRHDSAWPLAGIKTTSRADHVFARLEAERAGADDALFLTPDGRVAEATSANVFALAGGLLVTPPLSAGVLPGATRTWLLTAAAAARLGLRTAEADLRPDDLLAADEVLLTSSVAGLLPVVALDGRPIGSGSPGPRSRALREARERWIDDASRAGAFGPGGLAVAEAGA